MKIYIRATGNISPQKTFGHPPFLTDPEWYHGNRLSCLEPDYKEYIDVKMIRRMSRIIKMGVTAASDCLRDAALQVPDAIITGTAYGCLEDTGVFLTKMVEQQEEMLTPTAFIQSTHNTVGAQIALMIHCHRYNNTFVHRGFSFESALLDGMMLLQENAVSNALVGSVDEITNISHAILSRLNLYKNQLTSTAELYASESKGTIAGEGASFFLLTNEPSGNDYAQLHAITTFYKPVDITEIKYQVSSFLNDCSTQMEEISLIITGRNGDKNGDTVYAQLNDSLFKDKWSVSYKHLCGEYPTATSFALWMAANILKTNTVPPAVAPTGIQKNKVNKILIYNHYQHTHHSLLLLSAC